MPFPRFVARANRYVTNPILSRLAGNAGPFALMEHVGRKSGTQRQTPIMAFPQPNGFIVALTYGSNADWVKNVTAANRCGLTYKKKQYRLGSPEIFTADASTLPFPSYVKAILKANRVHEFLHLTTEAEVEAS